MEASEAGVVYNSVETAKTSNGPLLIFGQGPVIDKKTRTVPQEGLSTPGNEDVNLWSKNLARAASELYKRGQVPQIIVMGGKTGGEQYQSEAALIKLFLQNKDAVLQIIPEEFITAEEDSPDTILT